MESFVTAMKKPPPPRLAQIIVRFFVAAPYGDSLIDELDDQFAGDVVRIGRTNAALRYWRECVSMCTFELAWSLKKRGRKPRSTGSLVLWEFRYAFRSLARSPGFTAAALVTLALGIGTASSVMTVLDRVLLERLPYEDSDRLVSLLWSQNHRPALTTFSAADFIDLRERSTSFGFIFVHCKL